MPHAIVVAAAFIGDVFGAIGAFVGTVTGSAAIGTTVAAALPYAALAAASYGINKLTTPKVGGDYGTQVDFKADPQAGIPYAIGRTAVAGNLAFAQTAGAKNSWISYVSVYSLGPIDSYESFSVNGTAITFGTDSGEGASGYYQNRMWRKSQLGALPEAGYLHPTATGTKDTPADNGGFPADWTSSHKLSGLAADLWILQYNTGKYSAGTPQRLTVGKWIKAYDPRLDSTYPGGSGPQRDNDETTWAWSDNPYVHGITWLLGRARNGVAAAGVSAALAMVDLPAYVEGANIADANAWKAGGVVYTTDDKYEVLKAMLQAGGGQPMRLGAKISCLVATPRVSVGTITAADVVGEAAIAGTTTRRDRINTIWPKYRDEGQAWQIVTLDEPVGVSSYVTEDGGKVRSRPVTYPLVQDADQVAQLAYYDIADSREFTPVTLPCKPKWMHVEPGDVVTADEDEWGLNGQALLVLRRLRDFATGQVTLVCRSETTAKHAAALGQTGTAPSTPGLTAFDPNNFAAPGSGIYTAAGVTLTGAGGLTAPAIRVSGTVNSPDNPYAAALLVRFRLNGTSTWSYWPAAPIGADRVDVTGLVAGAAYDVEVGYRSARGTESGYTACTGGPFTAGLLTTLNRYTISATPPASPLVGDIWLELDGSGRVLGVETYNGAGWVPSSTQNDIVVSASAPATPTINQIWVELDANARPVAIRTWSGSTWVQRATSNVVTRSASAPSTPTVGDVWIELDANSRPIRLYTWSGSAWVGGATHNTITRSASAPATPTVNDIWVELDGGGTQIAVRVWNGSTWLVAGDLTSVNTAAFVTGQTAWATFADSGVNDPNYVEGQVQWLDFNGQVTDWRGFPYNVPIGYGGGRTTWPLTSTSTSITVTGYTEYRTGTNITIPSGTISGLSNDTEYDVFYFVTMNSVIAVDLSNSYLYVTDLLNYVYLGRQATKTGGGTYSTPAANPGGARGGGSVNNLIKEP